MKIFCVGLNKTGTSTLAACFRLLGYKHLSCRRDLLVKFRQARFAEIFAAIDEYESFEDWPYPLMYRELYARYRGHAKFILTVRADANVWLESMKKHSLRTRPLRHCRKLAYGHSYPFRHEEAYVDFYNQHNDAVRRFFLEHDPENFIELCWEAGHGWDELCNFLGREPPASDFPHRNATSSKSKTTLPSRREVMNRVMAGYFG